MKSKSLMGYQVSAGGLVGDVDRGLRLTKERSNFGYMACLNPHSLVEARRDQGFATALREADILIPDGTGIVMAARLLEYPVAERVAGFEYFYHFSETLNSNGGGAYFFLGATDEILAMIGRRLVSDFPNICVAGSYSPPFKSVFTAEENQEMLAKINGSCADVLWVGMTAPKQEIWINQNRKTLEVPFAGAIGAVFDFYAGSKKRSPSWVRNLGLEWLPRFLREPVRLFRRNFVSSPLFLALLFRQILKEKFSR